MLLNWKRKLKMRSKVLLVLLLILFGFQLESQNDTSFYKTLVHTIKVEAYSVGYSICQQIKQSNYFGFGIQIGASYRYFLNNPSYLHPFNKSDTTSELFYSKTKLKPVVYSSFEVVQVGFFYRKYLINTLYVNAGIYIGFGYLIGIENSKAHGSYGVFSSINYGFKHLKIGLGIMVGNTHITYNSENKTNIFSVLLVPVTLQINF